MTSYRDFTLFNNLVCILHGGVTCKGFSKIDNSHPINILYNHLNKKNKEKDNHLVVRIQYVFLSYKITSLNLNILSIFIFEEKLYGKTKKKKCISKENM